ncbi:MAG TPA: hypothetical protein VHD83_05955 [Puia sp.]|nr:hypothetical protein [Puia sp.]
MEIEQFIHIRLQIVNSVEPRSDVEDVIFYRIGDHDSISVALLPIEGLREPLDKEIARKFMIRKLLSGSLLSHVENWEMITELIYFSIDALTEVDHCFYIDRQTLQYEYICSSFDGTPLLSRSYRILHEANDLVAIDLGLSQNDVYYPSPAIDAFFSRNINNAILGDHRTIDYSSPLGYNIQEIRNKIIAFGLADFDQPYGSLTPEDKVNLYCYLNLKKHYFTSYALMERFMAVVDDFSLLNHTNFIDIGCGPLTTLLALADLYTTNTNDKLIVNYYGIDSSKTMLDKARQLSKAGMFHSNSSFQFNTRLQDIDLTAIFNNKKSLAKGTIINCSYLFGSGSLDVRSLSEQLRKVENTMGEIYLLFQNSTIEEKNVNWREFLGLFDLISLYSAEKIIYYHNRRSISAARKEEKVRFEIAKIITYDYAV